MTQIATVISNAAAKAPRATSTGRDGEVPDAPGGFTDVLRERQAAQAADGNDRKPAGDAGAEDATTAQGAAAATASPESAQAVVPVADPARLPPPDPASLPPGFFLNLIERATARADGAAAPCAVAALSAPESSAGLRALPSAA